MFIVGVLLAIPVAFFSGKGVASFMDMGVLDVSASADEPGRRELLDFGRRAMRHNALSFIILMLLVVLPLVLPRVVHTPARFSYEAGHYVNAAGHYVSPYQSLDDFMIILSVFTMAVSFVMPLAWRILKSLHHVNVRERCIVREHSRRVIGDQELKGGIELSSNDHVRGRLSETSAAGSLRLADQ